MSSFSQKVRNLIGRRRGRPVNSTVGDPEKRGNSRSDPRDHYDLEFFPDGDAPKICADDTRKSGTIVSHAFQLGLRNAVVLAAGESLETAILTIGREHVLNLIAAVPVGGSRPVRIRIGFESADTSGIGSDAELCTTVVGPPPGSLEQDIQLDLRGLCAMTGKFRVSNLVDGEGGECLVARLRVCPRDQLGLINAMSGYAHRMQGEVQHFSGSSYTHRMYGPQADEGIPAGVVQSAEVGAGGHGAFLMEQESRARTLLTQLAPNDQESAFPFAMRCLNALIPSAAPNFFARAAAISAKGPLRILSICAGAARIEEMILGHCKGPVELTLLDASEELIQRAAQRLQHARPDARVTCLIGDINDGLPGEGQFDVIVCVSALHHVANLERVLAQINERLTDDGEFWSIGEQVGRNGNRLWADAAQAASVAMSGLPSRLRKNAHTDTVDEILSDRDFSITGFEGIRSEELESKLESYLVPRDVYKRNAFLWRLVDATYSDNYVLQSERDVEYVKELVVAEALHWVSGGRSTELHGVYVKKQLKAIPPK